MNEKMNITKTLFIIMTFATGVIFGLYINIFIKEPKEEKTILNQEIVCKNLETIFKSNCTGPFTVFVFYTYIAN